MIDARCVQCCGNVCVVFLFQYDQVDGISKQCQTSLLKLVAESFLEIETSIQLGSCMVRCGWMLKLVEKAWLARLAFYIHTYLSTYMHLLGIGVNKDTFEAA